MGTTTIDDQIIISTDGACLKNPGPGGYGVLIRRPGQQDPEELSRGFRHTTNNRMEIMAVLAALENVPADTPVVIRSDSQYVVNAITKGWARSWRARGWMRNREEKALNPDLWQRMLQILGSRTADTKFIWVRGHSGDEDNAAADRLASRAAHRDTKREDDGYRK